MGQRLTLDEQAHLWDRFYFYRVHGMTARDYRAGLGLYISRTLIERQGGRVGVESAPGAGSTSWFALPLVPDTLPQAPAQTRDDAQETDR